MKKDTRNMAILLQAILFKNNYICKFELKTVYSNLEA